MSKGVKDMGSGNSGRIYYEQSSSLIQVSIFHTFKATLPANTPVNIRVHKHIYTYKNTVKCALYIEHNHNQIWFTYEPYLIDFICEIGRPIRLTNITSDGYDIRLL